MKKLITLLIMVVLVFSVIPAHAWLIYSKPEFRGRIIDAVTKEPIEGVVVVVQYEDHTIIGGPGGGGTSVIKVKETLTDQKGEFYFPSYTTLMGPNSREDDAHFIIFKPGYMQGGHASSPGYFSAEKFFSTDVIGKEGVLYDNTFPLSPQRWKGILGIVELERAKTRDDKWRAPMITVHYPDLRDTPLLYKAIEEAEKNNRMEGIR